MSERCRNKTEINSCRDENDNCSDFYDNNGMVCQDNSSGDNCKASSKKCRNRGGNPNRSITNLEQYETMRIIITYLVVFFMIMALMASSDGRDSLLTTIIISIAYLLVCALFDYLWMKYYLVENRTTGATSGRDMFHNILHLLLPGIVIIFGYSFLLSGFNSVLDTKNSKSVIMFMIKFISLISIIIGYVYYTFKLKKVIDESSEENINTQIDVLYSILHPVAILLISGVFYLIILFFINRKKVFVPTNLPKNTPVKPPTENIQIDLPNPQQGEIPPQ